MFYILLYFLFYIVNNSYQEQETDAMIFNSISVKNESTDTTTRPYQITRHLSCPAEETGRGPRTTTCMEASFQRLCKIIIMRNIDKTYSSKELTLPFAEKRSRLPRMGTTEKIRVIGPRFLQEPEDELNLREPANRWNGSIFHGNIEP